jgi:hypothetical protein
VRTGGRRLVHVTAEQTIVFECWEPESDAGLVMIVTATRMTEQKFILLRSPAPIEALRSLAKAAEQAWTELTRPKAKTRAAAIDTGPLPAPATL